MGLLCYYRDFSVAPVDIKVNDERSLPDTSLGKKPILLMFRLDALVLLVVMRTS